MVICIASLLLEDWVKEAVSENLWWWWWYCYLDSWHWRSTVMSDCQRQQGKGKWYFKCSQTWGLENAPILLLVSQCLAAACPHVTRSWLVHADTWLFPGWGLLSQHPEAVPDHTLRPLGVTFLKQSSAQAQVRDLADFCTGKARAVLFTVFWLKHHKAAFPLQRTQVRVFKFPLNNTREDHLLQQLLWSHHTAACLLQGTGGILLDELLVTGIADTLWVNTGREGQLICWTGFTEDTTAVLADILFLASAAFFLAELADLSISRSWWLFLNPQ